MPEESNGQPGRLFKYKVGDDTFYADPYELYRSLRAAAKDSDLAQLVQDAFDENRPFEARQVCWVRFVEIARRTFGEPLAPIDPKTGKGANEDEAAACLMEFLQFVALQKKTPATSPTTPPPTPATASAAP